MGKLLKFLKPHAGTVLAILCVLVVQAWCDLSLPTYTSDIVNVGIQQGGVDESVPEQIAGDELERLLLFVPSDEQDTVREAYEEAKAGEYDYDGTVLELKETVKDSTEELDDLAEIMGKPMLLTAGFESGSDTSKSMEETMRQQMQAQAGVDLSDMTIFDMLEMMDSAARDQVVAQMDESMDSMPDTMVEQAATLYIQSAYEELGIDMDAMQTHYILVTGGKMLALAALGMLASITVGLMASRVAASVGRETRGKVFQKVVGFSNGEFDKFSTASLITRSTNDIQQIQMLTVMILRMVLYAPIMAVGGIWKVLNTNVDMTWIIALGVALIFMVVIVLFLVVMPKFKIVQKMVDRLNLVSREILTGLQVIRAFGTERYEEERFDKANKDLTRLNLFVNRAMTFMMPVMMLVMNGISVLIVWTGAHSVNDGTMQVGDMMAFIQYTMQIIMSFLMICMISVMLPRAAVSAERVDEVLRSSTSISDPEKPEKVGDCRGEICFDHVSFRYPGAEEDVLQDLSFTVRPGQTTAIIGSTGSGKSTLVNLIPRFYDVTEGKITLDGHDIRSLTQHDLRAQLGYVPQKGVLFSGDIASNILYGNPEGSREEMEEAAQIAQATEFIDNKKKRYESPISQGGSNVSGGQKQRLSIARAIAKHPRVFIFDDSFSALDYKTDAAVRSALSSRTKDAAVIIVAQRISTILHAAQIIVLDDGKIAGIGTHRELLKNCEAYYQIASSQLSEEELERDMKEAV
ncbi:ABC transporter ATP-binding protein [Faecalicatena fissicatena]|uniref:ABC transporter ATP-binding protein n=1 Tax=Faecalicatena fissicatena TaxID=290055 RepID=A0ABS2E6Y0_9FIRM|nr:ABC transporter ATP-binding protein [Faecalicatena fissicatena]MBM6737375.1 ABC transporter ATP-binding protein [Faecalicatena fissicatena]